MIVVDTNVISEAMKPVSDEGVARWLRRQPLDTLYVTAITKAELLYGLALMPDGKRKRHLAETIQLVLGRYVVNPILAFTDDAALPYARLSARRRLLGRPIREMDGQIAAIASLHGFAVATRNTGDFEDCGIRLVNPWTHS